MATPMRYEVVKTDATTVDVSRQVSLAKLKYGVSLDRDLKLFAKSQGELTIKDWRLNYQDNDDWTGLNIYASADLIFACSIITVSKRGAYGTLRVFFELLGAANLPQAMVRRSTGLQDVMLADYLAASGLTLFLPTGVEAPNMYVAAGTGYDDKVDLERQGSEYSVVHVFSDGGSEFLEDVATFGTMLVFERPAADGFVMYPLGALADDDRRATAPATVVSRDQLIRRHDFQVRSLPWRYSQQMLNTAESVTESATMTVMPGNASFTLRHGVWFSRWFSVESLLGSDEADDWLEWTTRGSGVNQPAPTPVIAESSSGDLRVLVHDPSIPEPSGLTFNLGWNRRTSITIGTELVSAGDVGAEAKALATAGLPIPVSGANGDSSLRTVQALVNRLEREELRVISATRLLEQDGDLTPLQVACGEVVEIDVSASDHLGVLCSVEFQHKGLRPLELRWHALEVSDIPREQDLLAWRTAAMPLEWRMAGHSVYWERSQS